MILSDISADDFNAIFGPRDDLPPGRHRLCKVCGSMHSLDEPWPHNCRSEAPPRADLAAPQIAPPFQEGVHAGRAITSRNEERAFCDEFDCFPDEPVTVTAGYEHMNKQFETREYEEQLVKDIKKSLELDPLNIEPVKSIDEVNDTSETVEEQISLDAIENVKVTDAFTPAPER